MTRDGTDCGGHRPKKAITGSVPAELMPTPRSIAADTLADWIEKSANVNACGLELLRDQDAVVVYWKGTPPAELRSLAAAQAVPVSFHASRYSLADLDPVARQVLADHSDVVSSTGPNRDYSGISVTLWSTAPMEATMTKLNAESDVPVFFWKFADPVDLTADASHS
ncbi:hypothetical protein [Kribbella pratensis]|uniref:Uncharacterized protein n=1 Tax=Kribbella pratensis TaxID=2512112 RepID=A0A4R8C175_9ACTN|nr:hypothetical protein [Kribbella pratensis]TDW69468.1 hypothetical protein EV653_3493 [Kribbella pratensis]